jgi:hypothetical protein
MRLASGATAMAAGDASLARRAGPPSPHQPVEGVDGTQLFGDCGTPDAAFESAIPAAMSSAATVPIAARYHRLARVAPRPCTSRSASVPETVPPVCGLVKIADWILPRQNERSELELAIV